MIRLQVRTGLREKTLPVLAYSLSQLLFTGRSPEVGGRAAHIVDVSFEIRILYDQLRLLQNGFMASDLHRTPLMEGQRTEITAAEASPVADQGKLNLTDRRNAALLFIRRMIGAHIRQGIYGIHFFCGKRLRRRVLHHILASRISFQQRLSVKRIRIGILYHKAFRVFFLIFLHVFIGRQDDSVVNT